MRILPLIQKTVDLFFNKIIAYKFIYKVHIVTEKPNENIILNMRRKEKEASPGVATSNENFLKTTSSNESPPLSRK